MRKQRRILYDAISALVTESETEPIHDWIMGMNEVLRSAQTRPEEQRWWVRVFQAIGIGRSQHHSLETQRKDIELCYKVVWEILSNWNEVSQPRGWYSQKAVVRSALNVLKETLAGQQHTSGGLTSGVRQNDPTQDQGSNKENGKANEGGDEGRGRGRGREGDGEEEDDEKQDGTIEGDQRDVTEELDNNDESVTDSG